MQMRRGRATTVSGQSDPVTALNRLSAPDQDPAQMQITGGIMTPMADFKVHPGKRMTMDTGHYAVTDRENRDETRYCPVMGYRRRARARLFPSLS